MENFIGLAQTKADIGKWNQERKKDEFHRKPSGKYEISTLNFPLDEAQQGTQKVFRQFFLEYAFKRKAFSEALVISS